MGKTSFKHMDEARRRQVLASVAASAIAQGQLPAGSIDFAWLLFGDPEVATKVDTYVDMTSVSSFEREIERVKLELARLAGALLQPWNSPFPPEWEVEVREQLTNSSTGSTMREIARRIPLHLTYLRQRIVYLAVSRLLGEHYAHAVPDRSNTLVNGDWTDYEQAEQRPLDALCSALAGSVESMPSWATGVLARKAHKSRGRKRPASNSASVNQPPELEQAAGVSPVVPARGPSAEHQAEPLISSEPNGATQESDVRDNGPVTDGRATESLPVAQSISQLKLQALKEFENPPMVKIFIKKFNNLKLERSESDVIRGIDANKYITPKAILNYHWRRDGNVSPLRVRIGRSFLKYDLSPISCDFDGFLTPEPEDGLYELFEAHKRRIHRQAARNFEALSKQLPRTIGSLAIPVDLRNGIELFGYLRYKSGGAAFDDHTREIPALHYRLNNNSDPTDWWEYVYGYNGYTTYNYHLALIFLEGLSLSDAARISNSLLNGGLIPAIDFGTRGSFYRQIRDKNWRRTFDMKHLVLRFEDLIDRFQRFAPMENNTELGDEAQAYKFQRENWLADISAPEVRKDDRSAIFI